MALQQDLFTGEITEYCEDCDNGTDQRCINCQWHYSLYGKDKYQQFVLNGKVLKRGEYMKECAIKNCTSTELVYSGTDAFCLGVVTEQICYNCANTYAQVKQIVSTVNA